MVHVALIPDGNRRWARQHGKTVSEGHIQGFKVAQNILEAASGSHDIRYLTIWFLSEDNWNRPYVEISKVLEHLKISFSLYERFFLGLGVRVRFLGRRKNFSQDVLSWLRSLEDKTELNTGLTVQIALNYSGRTDILDAVNSGLSFPLISPQMDLTLGTAGIPDPDILIRTGGEQRLSNFMLWQLAYTELFFLPTLWPDFTSDDFFTCVRAFGQRERRFGAD